jgi:hypothetical protein
MIGFNRTLQKAKSDQGTVGEISFSIVKIPLTA